MMTRTNKRCQFYYKTIKSDVNRYPCSRQRGCAYSSLCMLSDLLRLACMLCQYLCVCVFNPTWLDVVVHAQPGNTDMALAPCLCSLLSRWAAILCKHSTVPALPPHYVPAEACSPPSATGTVTRVGGCTMRQVDNTSCTVSELKD